MKNQRKDLGDEKKKRFFGFMIFRPMLKHPVQFLKKKKDFEDEESEKKEKEKRIIYIFFEVNTFKRGKYTHPAVLFFVRLCCDFSFDVKTSNAIFEKKKLWG